MDNPTHNLETLKDIKKMMERSSRFISLSGFSGIIVGFFALVGAFFANQRINTYFFNDYNSSIACPSCLKRDLIVIAVIIFITAFVTAILFTFFKSKKANIPIWGTAARRLMWNTMVPMVAGGFFLWRMMELNQYNLIAAGCLIFYGLALVNGSKYTLGEVKYLGYAEIILGIINLWMIRSGLLFWAIGFGVFHIIYGVAMWWKYDRSPAEADYEGTGFKMEE
ncbi:MAG: hypothetical protein ABIW47_14675 [Ginsengibacter sp.]